MTARRFNIKAIPTAVFLLLYGTVLQARVPVIQPDLSTKTYIAPAFFGPNAFPVPDMSDGRIGNLSAELALDGYNGFIVPGAEDKAIDIFAKVYIPLLKGRVALSVWIPAQEWWWYDDTVMKERAITSRASGNRDSADAYVSTEIKVIEEKGWIPSFLIRAVLKSASGNTFSQARHYDSPGYFFDGTVANSLYPNGFFKELRAAACAGFLCWQTDNGRQNDAVQYGVMLESFSDIFNVQLQLAGYSGWEKCGDRPMTVRARVDFIPGKTVSPYFQYQRGLRDWPFDQYRLGVRFNIACKKK